MNDPDFNRIIKNEDDQGDNDDTIVHYPPSSPLLPPNPYVTPRHRYLASASTTASASYTMPTSVPRQTLFVELEDDDHTEAHRHRDMKGKQRAVDDASDRSPTPGPSGRLTSDTQAKRLPRPSSVVPRVGTLTALPGATMVEATAEPGKSFAIS